MLSLQFIAPDGEMLPSPSSDQIVTLDLSGSAPVPSEYITSELPVQVSTPVKKTRRPKWNYQSFIEEARKVHGDKFDYSMIVPDQINGYKSRVTLICRECKYTWITNLDSHVRGADCPDCQGLAKYTLERFLAKAKNVHKDKYDYSAVTEAHIKGKRSKIPVKCRKCNYEWTPEIANHINNETGCPDCSGNVPWSYEKLIQRANEKYGDSFDYSLIDQTADYNSKTEIAVTCQECKYIWRTPIDNFINKRNRCPDCNGHAHWDLDRLLLRTKEIYGDEYDYSLVAKDHIKTRRSRIPVRCNQCKECWTPTIHDHLRFEECPNCSLRSKWSLTKLKIRGKRVHGDLYDYSLVTEEHINESTDKIPVICRNCTKVWYPTINNHINNRTGCNSCYKSKGELACELVLTEFKIPHESEYVIPTLPRRYYDFALYYNSSWYFLEFDGHQHFEVRPYINIDEERLEENKEIDILKTKHALQYGYVIRIDHTQLNRVRDHIINALTILNPSQRVYFSTPSMYQHIIEALTPKGPVIEIIQ